MWKEVGPRIKVMSVVLLPCAWHFLRDFYYWCGYWPSFPWSSSCPFSENNGLLHSTAFFKLCPKLSKRNLSLCVCMLEMKTCENCAEFQHFWILQSCFEGLLVELGFPCATQVNVQRQGFCKTTQSKVRGRTAMKYVPWFTLSGLIQVPLSEHNIKSALIATCVLKVRSGLLLHNTQLGWFCPVQACWWGKWPRGDVQCYPALQRGDRINNGLVFAQQL